LLGTKGYVVVVVVISIDNGCIQKIPKGKKPPARLVFSTLHYTSTNKWVFFPNTPSSRTRKNNVQTKTRYRKSEANQQLLYMATNKIMFHKP
jgi:hypothetical protein